MIRPDKTDSIFNALWGVLAVIALLTSPASAQQPGRILVDNTGPSMLKFNIDGSSGFAIAGNTDNNAVFSPSVAGNGTIVFTANTDVDGTYLGHPYLFLMNADGTNVRKITSALPVTPAIAATTSARPYRRTGPRSRSWHRS